MEQIMERKQSDKTPFVRLVLLMVCLSVAGGGMAAAQGDSPDTLAQDDGQGPFGSDEIRCDHIKSICRGEANVPLMSCDAECKVKHLDKGDIIGQCICDGWCKTYVWGPVYHKCMRFNRCEIEP
jgi:hypothetical protein